MKNSENTFHLGVDFGSQMAGTTAICYLKNDHLTLEQSQEKRSADKFLNEWITQLKPHLIGIDAPLSLPAAYSGKGEDYFFRRCDREVNAMSPMFLGGLTARAMKLRSLHPSIHFIEAYPGGIARHLLKETNLYKGKKKEITPFMELLLQHLPYPVDTIPLNWHQVDAVLAWLVGYRHLQGIANSFGDTEEGLIFI